MKGSGTPANSAMFNFNTPLTIGGRATTQYLNGWIDEVRITKGVARYASDSGYTVPTAAFPRSSGAGAGAVTVVTGAGASVAGLEVAVSVGSGFRHNCSAGAGFCLGQQLTVHPGNVSASAGGAITVGATGQQIAAAVEPVHGAGQANRLPHRQRPAGGSLRSARSPWRRRLARLLPSAALRSFSRSVMSPSRRRASRCRMPGILPVFRGLSCSAMRTGRRQRRRPDRADRYGQPPGTTAASTMPR